MVSVGVTAPFTAVPLHAVARAQTHQITCLNGKAMMAWCPGSCRAMASAGVQPSSSHGQNVPKSVPFNQSRINRFLREPSLLEKAEHALAGMQSLNTQISTQRASSNEPTWHRMNKIPWRSVSTEGSKTNSLAKGCPVSTCMIPASSKKFG